MAKQNKLIVNWLLFLLIGGALFHQACYSKVIFISDIDDTIKVTHAGKTISMLGRHFFTQNPPFGRLIDIYKDVAKFYHNHNEEVLFYYVTASPKKVSHSQEWLLRNNAPVGKVISRKVKQLGKSIELYKKSVVEQILKEHQDNCAITQDCLVLLFGDNGQTDPEVYDAIITDNNLTSSFEFHPFIRVVDDKELVNPDQIFYFASEKDLISKKKNSFLLDKILYDTKINIRMDYEAGKLVPHFVTKSIEHFRGVFFIGKHELHSKSENE